ncbi:AfsR/SARP family transcriptional regulator [Actinophytocola sp.]|uniref:AfsR/SARP family transcriptional regulator n=1 Tax=Actinophytocola sp. TaxID=1872138 RepID=UPI002ED88DF0
MTVRFGVLGTVEVWRDGTPLAVPSGRTRLALAMMLLNTGRFTSTDRLIDGLWHDPPQHAKARLHNIIRDLRQRLGADAIVTRSPGYELAEHALDLAEFRRLVTHAAQLRASGDHAAAHTLLDSALALWRGPALADVAGDWADEVRVTLTDERLAAVEARLDARLDLERYDDALRELAELVADHPYRESLYARQLRALAGVGRAVDALETYRRVHRLFVDELGIVPGQELRDLERLILRGELPAPVSGARTAMPPPTLALTGRDKLISRIVDELRADRGFPSVALLVGPGGVGKTTAALAAAQELRESFPDGALFLDLRGSLDPLDPHEALGRLLRMLDVSGSAVPDDPDERVGLYRSRLATSRILVVLDDAATERQVRPLLPQHAGCGAVVTSRRQLGALIGPVRLTVPVLTQQDAVDLLGRIIGAGRTAAEPDAAVEVVALCGNLPLAVRVVAARLAVHPSWTLAELRTLLADERGRLNELAIGDMDVRATFELSYRTLDPDARLLFRRLGLLSTPDWPAWVAAELTGRPAGRVLDELADAHLVEPLGRDEVGQSRFRLHDLIAEFAAERSTMEESSSTLDAARWRVLSQWLALAAEADERVEHGMVVGQDVAGPAAPLRSPAAGAEPAEWFEVERISLTTAVDDACRAGHPDLAARLALRLAGFLALRSYDDDRERVLRRALAQRPNDRLGVRLLAALWGVCAQRDRYAELPALAAEELAAARRLGDREHELLALTHAGRSARMLGRFAEAVEWLDQAIGVARHPSMPPALLTRALAALAHVRTSIGDPAAAVELLAEAVELGDHTRTSAMHLHAYGVNLTAVGRLDEAVRVLTMARTLVDGQDERGAAWLDHALADVDVRRGRFAPARARLARALQVQEEVGDQEGMAEVQRSLADLALARGAFEEALGWAGSALEIWRRLDARHEVASILDRLATAHAHLGDEAAAASHHEESRALLANLNLTEAALRRPDLP